MNENLYYPCETAPKEWKLFAKKTYGEKVKTDSYEINLESKPHDNDIRNPKLNWFLPHYNRWGYEQEAPWTTTTSDMLRQCLTHQEMKNPKKKFLSYYTYHDKLDCEEKKFFERDACVPTLFRANDYATTMQSSYQPLRGYKTERLAIAKTPFLVNRRFLIENPRASRNKFWDDDHLQEIELLHKYKPHRQLSYNFMTGYQSDGTPLPKDRFTIL
ncbi:hypothetical protein HHI36_005637 [Cryptolaemus montrouzieri]|uniref:Uncharacterized protein n=1 Tax=Cryptolaemus montrouzieri TaxID=559131 RepID=A0ABD2NUQ6_9CUCU